MDRGLKRQREQLSLRKDLLAYWLPFRHFSEEEAHKLQGTTPEKVRLHFLQHFCGCDPKSLAAAAQFFGLDHTSTPDCAVLASILAEVLFGNEPKVGRKTGAATAWNGPALIRLGRRYRELKTANPNYTDRKIAELISGEKEFKQYRDPEAIRKKLRDSEAELFHMERSPGDYFYYLRVSGQNSIVKSLKRPTKRLRGVSQ